MQQEYLSSEKFQELKDELDRLKNEERKKVTESLEFAKSLGDLSENAEYHEARDMQAKIEHRISEIETMLKSAVVISGGQKTDHVQAGSVVIIQKKGDKTKREFTIVASEEADISANKISYNSPIGTAVMNKKKGDEFVVRTPGGEVTYTLLEIK